MSEVPYSASRLQLYSDQNGTVLDNPNNYLVVLSADYMNNVAASGEIYGIAVTTAERATQYGLTDVAAAAASVAAAELSQFSPKIGPFDAQYEVGTQTYLREFFTTPDYQIGAFTDAELR